MTIPEAVRLILHAGAVGRTGDVHVLNMGQPIRIVDLAHDLIRLASPGGGRDIEIVFSGLRPGEKLEETLFAEDEEAVETDSPFLLVARSKGESHRGEAIERVVERLERLAAEGRDEEVRAELSGGVGTSPVQGATPG
jgi:FlaA1/EpsC-like NDP-sugar epimerase